MPATPEELRAAVEAWVRAEYEFRLGGCAFTSQATEWYLKAERQLRRALTGRGDLEEAFVRLGGKAYVPPKRR